MRHGGSRALNENYEVMAPWLAEETVLAYLAKTPRVKRGAGGAKARDDRVAPGARFRIVSGRRIARGFRFMSRCARVKGSRPSARVCSQRS